MQIIHDCLVSVSKESLLDSLNRTLFQITSLDPEHAVQGLLEAFPWCDRYGAHPSTSGTAQDAQGRHRPRGGGWGGPTDSILCLCRVATAMWQTMVSEPRVAEDVLRSLLMQRTGPEHDGFGPHHSCVRSWAVSSWTRPRSPPVGLHSPPHPLLHSSPGPERQPPLGLPSQEAREPEPSRATCTAGAPLRTGTQPAPALPLSVLLPPHLLLPCWAARGTAAPWPKQAARCGPGSRGQLARPPATAGAFALDTKSWLAHDTKQSRTQRVAGAGPQARQPGSRLCPGVSVSSERRLTLTSPTPQPASSDSAAGTSVH